MMASVQFVETTDTISAMVGAIDTAAASVPSLYLDLEGANLCREGTISLLQLYHLPSGITYIVDIFTLQHAVFTTPSAAGKTLKGILEDSDIIKVFFDVRNDSDALFAHFGISLQGIHDLQLMEVASRSFDRRHVNGLAKCISRDLNLSYVDSSKWISVKDAGARLFAPEKGGRYEVFNERPLPEPLMQYCAQDVTYLERLWRRYDGKLNDSWRERVRDESRRRVAESQSSHYIPHGMHKAIAPSGW